MDADASPIPRFSLWLSEESAPASLGYRRSFETDDGRFAVMDIAPGYYQVSVGRNSPEGGTLRLGQVEIRKGYCYGDIIAQFPSTKDRK